MDKPFEVSAATTNIATHARLSLPHEGDHFTKAVTAPHFLECALNNYSQEQLQAVKAMTESWQWNYNPANLFLPAMEFSTNPDGSIGALHISEARASAPLNPATLNVSIHTGAECEGLNISPLD